MAKVHKLPAKHRQKALTARWTEIMAAYRRRHRTWVMAHMPTMPDDEWKAYERWVAEFGAATLSQTGRHGRKVRRQLRAARIEGPKLKANAAAYIASHGMSKRSLERWWSRWKDEAEKVSELLPRTVTVRARK